LQLFARRRVKARHEHGKFVPARTGHDIRRTHGAADRPRGGVQEFVAALVTYLSMLLMHSQMPANMQTTIINTITPVTTNAQRVRLAVFLIVTSSQYKVIH